MDLERTPSQLESLNLPSISPSYYRCRQISYNVDIIQTVLIPSIRSKSRLSLSSFFIDAFADGDVSHLKWVAPLGSGAVGIVLCPSVADIAIKVSI
jgi:hypothetical protein